MFSFELELRSLAVNNAGETTCKHCPNGKVDRDRDPGTACEECEAGTVQMGNDTTFCEKCAVGKACRTFTM